MQSLKGKRVNVMLDKATLELEKQYQKRKNKPSRSQIMRNLYYDYLREILEKGK